MTDALTKDMTDAFARAGLAVLERGWLSSNGVLFAGSGVGEAVLVDTGYWTHAEQTVALVAHALQGKPLHRIVNTHLHSDHCGGNHALQHTHGCAIDVPAGTAVAVDRWNDAALGYSANGQHCPRFVRSGAIAAGDEVVLGGRPWRAIASPGHDPDSLVLHDPELGLLISADALWENGFGLVFPELDGEPGFADARATLDTIAALDASWVIPGHGRPFGDAGAALERAHRRLDGLEADPARHARHAARVLIKFHLMERRAEDLAALRSWFDSTAVLQTIHHRFEAATPFADWCEALLRELVASGALQVSNGVVENR